MATAAHARYTLMLRMVTVARTFWPPANTPCANALSYRGVRRGKGGMRRQDPMRYPMCYPVRWYMHHVYVESAYAGQRWQNKCKRGWQAAM